MKKELKPRKCKDSSKRKSHAPRHNQSSYPGKGHEEEYVNILLREIG